MLHLAIECSGIVGSIALFDDNLPIEQLALPKNESSIRTLAPTIQKLTASRNARPKFLSVTNGPGSFTSLRVGLATAKMLAMAWQIPVVGVDSLAAIAHRLAVQYRSDSRSTHIIIPVINAFRKQVFTGAWQTSPTGMENLAHSQVVDATEWCSQPLENLRFLSNSPNILHPTHSPPQCILTGPGLTVYAPTTLPPNIELADPTLWDPQADDVAQIAWSAFRAGKAVSAHELSPNYVRASAAEDKLQ